MPGVEINLGKGSSCLAGVEDRFNFLLSMNLAMDTIFRHKASSAVADYSMRSLLLEVREHKALD